MLRNQGEHRSNVLCRSWTWSDVCATYRGAAELRSTHDMASSDIRQSIPAAFAVAVEAILASVERRREFAESGEILNVYIHSCQ